MDLRELGFGHVRWHVADGENMGGGCVSSVLVGEGSGGSRFSSPSAPFIIYSTRELVWARMGGEVRACVARVLGAFLCVLSVLMVLK